MIGYFMSSIVVPSAVKGSGGFYLLNSEGKFLVDGKRESYCNAGQVVAVDKYEFLLFSIYRNYWGLVSGRCVGAVAVSDNIEESEYFLRSLQSQLENALPAQVYDCIKSSRTVTGKVIFAHLESYSETLKYRTSIFLRTLTGNYLDLDVSEASVAVRAQDEITKEIILESVISESCIPLFSHQ